jgi:Tol biopolymer transport system component
MPLSAGTKLGTYQVVAPIGAGGMGEVYQAHDTKLGRDVAIKVLPEAVAHDAERLARFQREAKTLASLNHPNIATIHGFEQSSGRSFLVMELVPGETLHGRVRREGAVPIEEALAVAKQIAEALEAAHEKGIIHRDLKPANVKVTPEGKVKVLDFGLAKAFADDTSTEDMGNSPTLSRAATMQGVILGTAGYMSPEQARGRAVDKRTDIWAFGCVLYEILTGNQAFHGEDITEILASVVKSEPDWTALPPNISPSIRVLLQRCLRKDRRQRTPDAAILRIEIEDAIAAPKDAAVTSAAPSTKGWRERVAWAVAAGVLALTAIAFAIGFVLRAPKAPEAIRFFVSPPDTWTLMGAGTLTTGPISVSPDGHRIVFLAASADGKSMLWVRSLDTLSAQALAGTEGALRPFWSPDSRFVGFFVGGKLKKIDVSGGPPITLCDSQEVLGGTWNHQGVIVFSPAQNSALQKVSAAGGVPTAATVLGQGEAVGHRMPFFLPDGRHFLYRANKAGERGGPVYVASLDSSERKLLMNSDSSNVLYTQGHLLFLRETTLMAQPFDPQRLALTGEAFPIAEQIQTQGNPPAGVFSVSENGVLAYQTGSSLEGFKLTWFDRSGKQMGILGDPAIYGDLELAPDGKRASVSISEAGKGRNIWIYDVARSLKTRYTFDAAIDGPSIWSPDGSRVVFTSNRKGHFDLYQNVSDGSGTEAPLLEDNFDKIPGSWSPDGRFILFTNAGGPTGTDLFVLPLTGDRKPVPFLNTQFNESYGRFSPDGRWVAYRSNESGVYEVYVAPFPGPGGKRQISTAGGNWPRWRGDGTEIFYFSLDNKVMVAAVNGKGSSFEVGAVKPLFDAHVFTGLRYPYDVTADGQRFLLSTVPGQSSAAPITVVVNWTAGLKK